MSRYLIVPDFDYPENLPQTHWCRTEATVTLYQWFTVHQASWAGAGKLSCYDQTPDTRHWYRAVTIPSMVTAAALVSGLVAGVTLHPGTWYTPSVEGGDESCVMFV